MRRLAPSGPDSIPRPGQHVFPGSRPLDGQWSLAGVDPVGALAGRERAAGAEQQRGDEQPQLIHLSGVQERADEPRPALDQHRGRAAPAELVEPEAEPVGPIAGGGQHLDPRLAQRRDPVGRGVVGTDDEHGHLARGRRES